MPEIKISEDYRSKKKGGKRAMVSASLFAAKKKDAKKGQRQRI
jgi:hypothetical protein